MSKEQEIAASPGDQWVLDVISKVRESHPLTDSNLFTLLGQLLQSDLSDRELTPANLKEVANTLVNRFVLTTAESEANNED